MDRYGRMPIIRLGFLAGIVGLLRHGGRLRARHVDARAAGPRARRRLRRRRPAVAGGRGRDVPARAPGARDVLRPLRLGHRRRARARSSSARCSPARHLTADELVVPWLAAGAFLVAGLVIAFFVRPDPSTIAKQHGDSDGRRLAARGDPPPPGRPARPARRGGQLRRDGVGDEPLRLRRTRPRARAGRGLPDHQRAHRRHVRARHRRRRPHRPHRAASARSLPGSTLMAALHARARVARLDRRDVGGALRARAGVELLVRRGHGRAGHARRRERARAADRLLRPRRVARRRPCSCSSAARRSPASARSAWRSAGR